MAQQYEYREAKVFAEPEAEAGRLHYMQERGWELVERQPLADSSTVRLRFRRKRRREGERPCRSR